MASWTGTYAITTPGTSLTAATGTTATNSGATWPTSPSLANMYIRLLTGTGSPATVPIVSNTATAITVASWPNGTPSSGTTYEIVLIFNNGDAITGATLLNTNMITEIAANAVVTVNGAFSLTFENSCTVRWGMAAGTMPTICAQNRTSAGKQGSWGSIILASTLSITPSFSYIKIQDAANGLDVAPSAAVGTASTIHHIWVEDCLTQIATITGAAATSNMVFANIFARNTNGNLLFSSTTSTNSQVFDTCWVESSVEGNVDFSSGGSNLQWLRNSVMKSCVESLQVNANSGVEFRISECYFFSPATGTIVHSNSSSTDAGTHNGFMNRINGSRWFAGAGTGGGGTMSSFSNDLMAGGNNASQQAISIASATSYTTATSNFDYMAGNNTAAPENVDTTSGAKTSTATPNQFENLTANRTNANSSPNFPLTINNISAGSPTTSGVTITFDCQNGAQSGQGSTVNVTSNSGQAVLSVAATTGYVVGATVEIGYGTARAETGRILSISAGTSITLEQNLAFTHTSTQADPVNLALRQYGLPFVRYGTASGSYSMQTQIPDSSAWGPLWCGLTSTFNGQAFTWKRTGHSVALADLLPGTTYYYTPYAYNPLGELVAGTESTFTTASASGGTLAAAYS